MFSAKGLEAPGFPPVPPSASWWGDGHVRADPSRRVAPSRTWRRCRASGPTAGDHPAARMCSGGGRRGRGTTAQGMSALLRKARQAWCLLERKMRWVLCRASLGWVVDFGGHLPRSFLAVDWRSPLLVKSGGRFRQSTLARARPSQIGEMRGRERERYNQVAETAQIWLDSGWFDHILALVGQIGTASALFGIVSTIVGVGAGSTKSGLSSTRYELL